MLLFLHYVAHSRTEVISNNDEIVSEGFKLMKVHGGREYRVSDDVFAMPAKC